MPRGSGWLRRTVGLAAGSALVVLAVAMFMNAAAARYSDRAELVLRYYAQPEVGRLPSLNELDYLERLIARSQRIAPWNPQHLERRIQRVLWQLALMNPEDPARAHLIEDGLKDATKGLAVAPGWALGWARFITLKSEDRRFDAAFSLALERVGAVGAFQPTIQSAVVNAVLPSREDLKAEDQEVLSHLIQNGLRQRPEYIAPVLKSFEAWGWFCKTLPSADMLSPKYCHG